VHRDGLLLLVYFSLFTSAARAYAAQVARRGIGDKVANTVSANEVDAGYRESALVQDGMLERNTVLLQKPFRLKRLFEVIQHMNSGVRG
jgi:hypothetical protein